MIQVNTHVHIVEIRLNNGVTNAIGPELVREMYTVLDHLPGSPGAVVITGNGKFLSMGLDLPGIIKFNRQKMASFFNDFQEMLFKLGTLPLPTVCAVGGHAPGGGTVLALCCDHRIAREDKIKLGMNESRLGLPIPFFSQLLLRETVGIATARRLLLEGPLISSPHALDIGLVDRIVPAVTLPEQALAKADALADIPARAYATIKETQQLWLVREYRKQKEEQTRIFLDLWFDPATQERLNRALEKF